MTYRAPTFELGDSSDAAQAEGTRRMAEFRASPVAQRMREQIQHEQDAFIHELDNKVIAFLQAEAEAGDLRKKSKRRLKVSVLRFDPTAKNRR